MTTTVFGIPNCDTVKKARNWLTNSGQDFTFHDFRKDGLDAATVETWIKKLGTEVLVNKRSTTWKQLSDNEKKQALSTDAAQLIVANPTLIKRPVLVINNDIHVGFKPDQYASIF